MNLQPSDDQPALWINPNWQEGTPGTFVVVIGVSEYTHLNGGSAPTLDHGDAWIREARKLGQLQVSALTGYEIFQWLQKAYHYDTAPLAKCWLLLSPTAAEKQHTPNIEKHLSLPTLANCSNAIKSWYAAIRNLPKPAQHESRVLFFFSGHGLQVTHERQVLLPADYLGGDLPHWDDALSTYNLRFGMESLEIPHRFYFIDACRNDFQAIRSKGVRGREILPEDEAMFAYDGIRAAAILYATSAAMPSWQPNTPANGLSIYGRALLDGLYGRPDIELGVEDDWLTVGFGKLESFVAERVVELIDGFNAPNIRQPVQPSGIVRDEIVTALNKQSLQDLRPAVKGAPVRGPEDTLIVAGARSADDRSESLERIVNRSLVADHTVDSAVQKGIWAESFSIGHSLFGSEQVTDLWNNHLRIFAIAQQRWLANDQVTLYQVQHDDTTSHYRSEIQIDNDDACGHWLQLADSSGAAYACVLAGDYYQRPRYALELDLIRPDPNSNAQIARLEAQLALENPGSLGSAAQLWQKYRNANIAGAIDRFELSELREMVRGKLESPLSAAVSALILLRANRLDLLHDWPRNLANWVTDLADGPVIWAEQVSRQQKDYNEAAEYLGLLKQRGLPVTSEAFSHAVSLADRLHSVKIDDAEIADHVAAVRERLQSALQYFRPGGLFASYSHFDPNEIPAGIFADA